MFPLSRTPSFHPPRRRSAPAARRQEPLPSLVFSPFLLLTMPAANIDHNPRTAATDEDGGDGCDTPRSGVATPQPDLQDKRLPGIMSYFGQVRQDTSLATDTSSCPSSSAQSIPMLDTHEARGRRASGSVARSHPKSSLSGPMPPSGLQIATPVSPSQCEALDRDLNSTQKISHRSHPYPTPPTSLPSSAGGSHERRERRSTARSRRPESSSEENSKPSARTHSSSMDASPRSSRVVNQLEPANYPRQPPGEKVPQEPQASGDHKAPDSEESNSNSSQASGKWFSLDGLKELTRGVFKSGNSTPTRALSTAQPSHAEGKHSLSQSSNDGAEKSGTQTPRGTSSTGAQAPLPKGKLTIKIPEARGLRKSRDPYVVVVFQRSELISGGPREIDEEDDDDLNVAPPGAGGIPIQRQGSDSGRPPMSIPMRSRQSSNTSVGEQNSFRNRSAHTAFTNPKWDSEAIL